MVLDRLLNFQPANIETAASRTRMAWSDNPTKVKLYDAAGEGEHELGVAIACPNIARPWHPLYDAKDPELDLLSNDWLQSLLYFDPKQYDRKPQASLALQLISAGLYYAAPGLEGQDSVGCQARSHSNNVQKLIVDEVNGVVKLERLEGGPFYVFSVIDPIEENDSRRDLENPAKLPMVVSEFRLVRRDKPGAFRSLIEGKWKNEYEMAKSISDANDRKRVSQDLRDDVEHRLARMALQPQTTRRGQPAVTVFNRPTLPSPPQA